MEYLKYAAAIIAGLIALRIAFGIVTTLWAYIGIAALTMALTVLVGPADHAAIKAQAFMNNVIYNGQVATDREIDRNRERMRRSILKKTPYRATHPFELALMEKLIRRISQKRTA